MRITRWLAAALAGAAVSAGGASGHGGQAQRHCTASSSAARSAHSPSTFVPAHPTSMLLCHYGPLPQRLLLGSRRVTSAVLLRRITRRLNALPAMPREPIACPADNGAVVVIHAFYAHAPARIIDVQLSGCEIVSRGSLLRWDAPDHGRFVGWLAGLIP
jgi:hypothetical protein